MKHKRLWSSFVALAVSITSLTLPSPAFAEEETGPAAEPAVQTDMEITGNSPLGNMLADKLTAEQTALNTQNGCGIYEVQLSDTQAYVQFDTTLDCTLLLTLYDDAGENLLTSAKAEVTTEQTEITLDVPDMPESCYLRACLIDTETLAPISAEYTSALYTQEMQEFLSKTTDDFEADRVLNLDDNDTTNFAVFSDEVILLQSDESVNTVISADDSTKTYVISSIDDTVQDLKQGDVFALGNDAVGMIIVTVDTITIDDTTATITGADMELEDVFEYLRLESNPDAMEITQEPTAPDEDTPIEMISLEDADAFFDSVTPDQQPETQPSQPKPPQFFPEITFLDTEGTVAGLAFRVPISTLSKDEKTAMEAEKDVLKSFEPKEKADGFSPSKPKLIADIVCKLDFKFKFYVSTAHQYLHLEPTFTIGLEAGIELKGTYSKRLTEKPIGVSFFKVINLELVPRLEIEGKVKGTIEGTIKYKPVISFDSETDQKSEFLPEPDIALTLKVVGTIFLGVSVAPALDVLKDDKIALKLELKAGFEAKAEWSKQLLPPEENQHDCDYCIDGEINQVCSMSTELIVLNLPAFTYEWKLADISEHYAYFYYSLSKNELGWGKCPYDLHTAEIRVVDADTSKGLTDAEIIYRGQHYKADENGVISVLMPFGRNEYTANCSNYQSYNDYIDMGSTKTLRWTSLLKSGSPASAGKSRKIRRGSDSKVKPDEYIGEPDEYGCLWANNVRYQLYDDYAVVSGTITTPANPGQILDLKVYSYVNGLPVTAIERFAFNDNKLLHSIRLPATIHSIGDNAFTWCTSLNSIHIPESVEYIGTFAFASSGLTSVTIPGKVQTIYENTFSDCNDLTTVIISEGVEYINKWAFLQCAKLSSITLSDSLKSIGEYAFENCPCLTSIYFPAGLEYVDISAFSGWTELSSFEVDPANWYFKAVDGVLFNGDMTQLVQYPGRNPRTSYTVPDSVTCIGDSAFADAANLISVTLPENLKSIDGAAFYNCTALTDITLPDSVSSIEAGAFQNCESLTSITLPDGITEIQPNTFAECTSLSSVFIPDSVAAINTQAFMHCGLTSIHIPNSVRSFGFGTFTGCTDLTSFTMPKGIETIGLSMFQGCTNLKSVYIPVSVHRINEYEYFGTAGITDIYYAGTEEEWEAIEHLEDLSAYIGDAVIHYNSTAPDTAFPVTPLPRIAIASAAATVTESATTTTTTTTTATEFTTTTTILTETEPIETTTTTSGGETDLTALTPNSVYNIYALADRELGVSDGNLLWFEQAVSDENGAVVVNYTGEVFAVKAKYNLANAECTVPELAYDGTEKEIFPTVNANGKTLTEGEDYWVSGSYTGTDGGVYSILLEGTGDYFGEKTLTYIIDGKETATLTGDVDLNGTVTITDAVLLMRLVSEDSAVPVAYSWANADTDSDGMLTITDVTTLLQALSEP